MAPCYLNYDLGERAVAYRPLADSLVRADCIMPEARTYGFHSASAADVMIESARLLADAENGKFDAVIIYVASPSTFAESRFGRSFMAQAIRRGLAIRFSLTSPASIAA